MVEPDVAKALRSGPFAVALDVAVDASGLTLERVSTLLAERGIHLSRATLSYWRSGRSHPERESSLTALPALEEILQLPSGSLAALLRSRGPKGVRRPPGTLSRRRVWPAPPALLEAIDAPLDGQLEHLAINDLFVVEAGSGARLLRVRLVMRALRDHVGRAVVYYEAEDDDEAAPRWAGMSRCRLGRVRTEGRVTVAELILDRPLTTGECTIIDYDLHLAPDPTNSYYRSFTRPCALWTCEIKFAGALPSRVFRFRQRHTDDERRDVEELWLGADRVTLSVVHNVRPGISGMYWE